MKKFPLKIVQVLKVLRREFGDDNLFLTFLVFDKEGGHHESTFGKDNIENLEYWSTQMLAKLMSGPVKGISLVARIFLDERVQIENLQGERVSVPKKEMYHFLFEEDKTLAFSKKETEESQFMDSATGNPFPKSNDIECLSSIDLLEWFE